MKIQIEINTENAAFNAMYGGTRAEVIRILDNLVKKYREKGLLAHIPLYDINGNAIGHAKNLLD